MSRSNRPSQVVVTGTGILTPGAVGTSAYLKLLRGNICALTGIPRELAGYCESKMAGSVRLPDQDNITRLFNLASTAAAEALNGTTSREATRIGLCFGSAISNTLEIEKSYFCTSTQRPAVVRFGTVTDELFVKHNLNGPRFTISTGCVAGIDSLGIAYDQIALGKVDAMLVVAAEATMSPIVFAAFERIGALSKGADPSRCSQPFGSSRDGFVLSEGAAAVLLENSEHAVRRGARPLAALSGWASVNSAYHMTSMRTDGSDLIRAISQALESSKCDVGEVDLVDFHGTSTQINDLAEANAIKHFFGGRVSDILFSAQKANVGHSLGASNLIEVVGLSWMIHDQFVPAMPTAHLVDETLGVPLPNTLVENRSIKNALKLSSSFSGIHTALVLKRDDLSTRGH